MEVPLEGRALHVHVLFMTRTACNSTQPELAVTFVSRSTRGLMAVELPAAAAKVSQSVACIGHHSNCYIQTCLSCQLAGD